MKNTIRRTLSLLLVLAMVLTFVPMSLAADGDGGAVSVSPHSSTLTLGEDGKVSQTFSVTVTACPENYHPASYVWYVNDEAAESGPQTSLTKQFDTAGDYTVKCEVEFEPNEGTDGDKVYRNDSASVTVAAGEVTLNSVTISDGSEVQVGKTIKLSYTTDPADYTPKDVKWASNDTSVATVDDGGAVKGVKVGEAVISLNVDGKEATRKIKVVEAKTTVTVPESITVKVDENEKIDVTFDPEDAEKEATVTYTSKDTTIAKVSSTGRVTGKKAGKTEITVKISGLKNLEKDTYTVPVTVTNDSVTCDYKYASASSSSQTVTLKPKYSGSSKNVEFTYTVKKTYGSVSIDSNGVVTAKGGVAAILVTVTAVDKDTKAELATCSSGASFYETKDVDVTMPDDNTTLTFGEKDDITETGSLYTLLTKTYTAGDTDRFYVTGLDSAEGTLSASGWFSSEEYIDLANLRSLKFTVGTKGKAAFDYEITWGAYSNLPLRKGEVTISYDGEVGKVEFSGTYGSSLTLGESSFEKFWDDCDMSGDLDYIQLNTLPSTTYGSFYTSKTTKTTAYLATKSHEFYDDYTSSDAKSNTYAKDLDLLTFVPVSTKKDTYDVVVSFTAYGEKSGQQVTGNIVIHMNETSNDITSRGIFFGTQYDTKNKLNYADKIADVFEDATDEDLGYVIFTLPDAEKAHLYVEIPSSSSGNTLVAQGEHLSSKTKLYYDTTDKKVSWLENAALIPAAGYSGKITLSYTAYSEDGDTSKEGTITFNVTKKTKSSVFSDVTTSYSWAADSVDFLYYEGTAQGANGKYNPNNYITRGDFMLMLYRAFLEDEYSTYNVTTNFSDVVKGTSDYSKETYQAVGVAKYLGIAQGSNNKFNPKNSITREEAMTLIQRTLNKVGRTLDYTTSVKASSFSDYSSVSSYAKTSIDALVKNGVVVGSNNKINPKSYITRAEMACILHRVITY